MRGEIELLSSMFATIGLGQKKRLKGAEIGNRLLSKNKFAIVC